MLKFKPGFYDIFGIVYVMGFLLKYVYMMLFKNICSNLSNVMTPINTITSTRELFPNRGRININRV